jgi:hypothetical protein
LGRFAEIKTTGGRSIELMNDAVDPRRLAAEIYAAVQNARRDDVGVAALCAALDLLAESRGQNKFRHAASVLRGTELRRSAIDDREALRRIAAFSPAQRRGAVGIVARRVAGPGAAKKQVAAIAHRLRRKLENETNTGVLSTSSIS